MNALLKLASKPLQWALTNKYFIISPLKFVTDKLVNLLRTQLR